MSILFSLLCFFQAGFIIVSPIMHSYEISMLLLRLILIIIIVEASFFIKRYNKVGYFSDRLKEIDIINIKYTGEKFDLKEYLRASLLDYPMLSISTIGLVVNQFYPNSIIYIDIMSSIPIIRNIYVNSYPLIAILVFLIVNYIKYIKNDLVRKIVKIAIILFFPIAIPELLLGLTSISIGPIYKLFKSPDLIDTLITDSCLVIIIVPILIIYIL